VVPHSFGFNDGLSQPAIQDVDTKPVSGQETVPQGIALLGRPGDDGVVGSPSGPGTTRPSWALDGSFLVFRYLKQLVPEFNAFLEANAIPVDLPIADGDPTGAELLGARLVGRWKSGTYWIPGFSQGYHTMRNQQNGKMKKRNRVFINTPPRCTS
jgi:deferrochelatase/peroxidase EfeB